MKNEEDPLGFDLKNEKEGLGERRFTCNKCDFITTVSNDRNRHIKFNHERVRYPCVKCEYTTTHKYSLKLHIQSKHEGVRYPCIICGSVLASKRGLKKHRKKHKKTILDGVQNDKIST